jgi:hypothetical protein
VLVGGVFMRGEESRQGHKPGIGNPFLGTVFAVLVCSLFGCQPMSEFRGDDEVGLNGSFEVVRDGLPVNWRVYTPSTIPTADYDLIIDTIDYRSGKQSLKFIVRECTAEGGWRSPGISQQFEAETGETYTVGFWVKNRGAAFQVRIGGVDAKTGDYVTLYSGAETDSWQYFEREYTLADEHDQIRVEFNVLRPGIVWIDEVTIGGIS